MTMKEVSMKGTVISTQNCYNECTCESTIQYCSYNNCCDRSTYGQQLAAEDSGLQNTPGYSQVSPRNCKEVRVYQNGNHNADNILISREVNPRKREKVGFFRSLRRRLSLLSLRRRSDTTDRTEYDVHNHHHVKDCQSQSSTPILTSSSLADKIRQSHNIEPKLGSQSCDSFSCPLRTYLSPKVSEWHSKRNHCNSEAFTENSSHCLSKDISQFNSTSSIQNDEFVFEESTSSHVGNLTVNIKKIDKTYCTDFVCESDSHVEFDPLKEKMKIWSLTQELIRLSKFGWYWGPISRNEAEKKLTNQPDGAFLVRDSSDERYLLSLSFRSYGCTYHTRIEHYNGMFSFYAQPDIEGYPSIVELIEQSMSKSHTGIFYFTQSLSTGAQQFPVRLTKPVSRYTQVRSLQYLCRFVIRQHTRYDHIQQLPLPTALKSWIEESQY